MWLFYSLYLLSTWRLYPVKAKKFGDESILIGFDMTMIIWKHPQQNLQMRWTLIRIITDTNWNSALFIYLSCKYQRNANKLVRGLQKWDVLRSYCKHYLSASTQQNYLSKEKLYKYNENKKTCQALGGIALQGNDEREGSRNSRLAISKAISRDKRNYRWGSTSIDPLSAS